MNKDLREIKVILVHKVKLALKVLREIPALRENKALKVRPVRRSHMICSLPSS